ncbi:hypothetical protein [Sphingomonas sp. Leaf208]|uniref:hypothetical protein n=1 Tax=Sphingomonas sp. Leaf208 TaxID=1735679 RepID=UPI0012E0F70C
MLYGTMQAVRLTENLQRWETLQGAAHQSAGTDCATPLLLSRVSRQAQVEPLQERVASLVLGFVHQPVGRLTWSLWIALFDRLRFRGILLATRKEGIVTPLHIGMIGTINAEQLSANSDKMRDALVGHHAMGKNPGGSAYGYEKRIESLALGIVPLELWDRVKFRQATLAHTAKPRTEMISLPFFAQQRPRYLLTGKMTFGRCCVTMSLQRSFWNMRERRVA